MERKRLLYVGDGGSAPALAAELADVDVVAALRSIPVSVPTWRRHLLYLGMAIRTALEARRYDKIFFHQQFVAVYYSLLASLVFARTPYLLYYIITKPGSGLFARVKVALLLRMLRDPANVTTYFMTAADHLYRRVQGTSLAAKIRIHNGLDVDVRAIERFAQPAEVGRAIFSGGTSNRDYRDMAALGCADPGTPITIACRPEDVRHLDLPGNVTVRTDAYGEAFARLLTDCRLVVIPVADPDVMSGQLVCIQAFAAGKVVLFRRNNFLHDWLGTVERLPFLRMYDDADQLCRIVAELDDATLLTLGEQAREYYLTAVRGRGLYAGFARDIRATPWRTDAR